MQEEKTLRMVCSKFRLEGEYLRYNVINSGHINSTYQVFFKRNGEEKDYIIQKLNTYVFQNPVAVMENIAAVTEFIRKKIKETQPTAKRNVLHYVTAEDGKYYTILEDGSFWRCCRYIDNSICLLKTDNLKLIEEAGKAFGAFQLHLSEYPVKNLHIVIPHFHNTIMRYQTFKDALEKDEMHRAEGVKDLINAYLAIEEVATKPYCLQKQGVLNLRVTHNDTKISNVLFDKEKEEYLAVIDLDTVMPGLIAFDFGDAIRIVGSKGEEDEKDLSKAVLDLEKYEAFTKGFVEKVKDQLTEAEKETLSLGAIAMTAECGVRFLTDYLNGDKYFRIHYEDQNLVRARCHLVYAKDMIARLDEMQAVVAKYCK